MSLINFPILYIPDPDKGRPLFNAKIYVGKPDLDPAVTINQKQLNIIQENGTVVPVSQPFSLSAGGVPVYNGKTVRLDVEGKYSIKILSKLGAQVYYIENVSPNVSVIDSLNLPLVFNDVNALVTSTNSFTVDKILTTRINNTFTKTGGADYRVNTLAQERIDRNDAAWVPDGAVSGGVIVGGSHYLEGGTTKVAVIMNRGTLSDSQFGVIGNDDNGIVDDYPALSRFFDEIRTGKALGGRKTGGIRPLITPRSLFYISATLDFIDLRILVNGGQSEIRPTVPGLSIVNLEQTGGGFEDFQLWHDHLDAEQVLTLAKPAIALSGGQPVAVTSESTFTKMSRILTYNAYRNVELDSISPDGGLIWQFIFENVLSWDSMDYGIYLWSVAQTSTTTTLQNCHTKSVSRSAVQRNGKVFRALQHMLSTNIIEPEVTTGWENYWLLGKLANGDPEVPSTQAAWASGTFYRTNGKGYLFNNVQTVFMGNCSSDGGSNFTEGNVVSCLNSILTIDTFHLEGTNLNFADRPPFIINSDMNFGSLYLFDLRIQMPNVLDRCALIGGNLSRERSGDLFLVRNQSQNAIKTGDIDYVRLNNGSGQDFSRFSCGIGAPSELVTGKETTRAFTASRDNSRTADLTFVMASTTNYYKVYEAIIPDVGAAEATFQEFSDIVEITSNSGNDDIDLVGRYAKVRVSVFVQSGTPPDKSQFDLEIVNGSSGYIYQTFNTTTRLLELWVKCKANGQSSIANYKGRGNGFDVSTGKQRMLYSAVEVLGTTVEAQEGFTSVTGSGANAFVEIIPAGSYTSGDYNLPSGKTFADITKLKVITKTGDTVSQYEIDTALIPSQSEAFGYRGGSGFATVFPLGFLSTATALRVGATSAQVLYCSAVF
jgi:hypothetical protein